MDPNATAGPPTAKKEGSWTNADSGSREALLSIGPALAKL